MEDTTIECLKIIMRLTYLTVSGKLPLIYQRLILIRYRNNRVLYLRPFLFFSEDTTVVKEYKANLSAEILKC